MLWDMEEKGGSSIQRFTKHMANNAVKCNYIIYWSGKTGMELVEKWEIEGKIHDGNKNTINRYFDLFEEHIAPKLNTLIAVVELKEIVPRFHEFGRLPH